MVKIKKYTLSQLSKCKMVLSEMEQRSFCGGGDGSSTNPYTMGEFTDLLGKNSWKGGYVEYLGYVRFDEYVKSSDSTDDIATYIHVTEYNFSSIENAMYSNMYSSMYSNFFGNTGSGSSDPNYNNGSNPNSVTNATPSIIQTAFMYNSADYKVEGTTTVVGKHVSVSFNAKEKDMINISTMKYYATVSLSGGSSIERKDVKMTSYNSGDSKIFSGVLNFDLDFIGETGNMIIELVEVPSFGGSSVDAIHLSL